MADRYFIFAGLANVGLQVGVKGEDPDYGLNVGIQGTWGEAGPSFFRGSRPTPPQWVLGRGYPHLSWDSDVVRGMGSC